MALTRCFAKRVVGSVYQDQPANSAALVGLLDDPQRLSADRLVQYFDSGRHLSIWPVGCAFIGDQFRCGIAVNVSLTEADTVRDEGRWRRLLTHLCPDLRELVNDGLGTTSLRIFTYRDVELTRSCVGRVAIIGDAAHSMSPQLGTGAQLAMEDAETLARVVDVHNGVADALRAFTRDSNAATTPASTCEPVADAAVPGGQSGDGLLPGSPVCQCHEFIIGKTDGSHSFQLIHRAFSTARRY